MATAGISGVLIVAVALMMGFCMVVSGHGMQPEPPSAGGYMAPAEGPSSDDCLTKLLNMSDCLSYVTEGSTVKVPEKPCCPELAGLVDSSPICLCELLGKSDSYGIKIDMSRALKLPSVCGVSTPPLQLCSAVGVPVGGPTASAAAGLAVPGPGPSISPVSGHGMVPEPPSAGGYMAPLEGPSSSSWGYMAPAEGPSSSSWGYMAPAEGPSSEDCLTKLLNMSDCLSYVTEGSTVKVPEKPCCPELAGLVDSSPICLCDLLGKSDSYGIKIDKSRALKLPSICGVSTPPPQLCSVVGVPVGGPTPSASVVGGGPGPGPGPGNSENGASTTPTILLFFMPILTAALPFQSFFSF